MMSALTDLAEIKKLAKLLDEEMPDIEYFVTRVGVTASERNAGTERKAHLQMQLKELKEEAQQMQKSVKVIQEELFAFIEDHNRKMRDIKNYVSSVVDHLSVYGYKEKNLKDQHDVKSENVIKNEDAENKELAVNTEHAEREKASEAADGKKKDLYFPDEPEVDATVVALLKQYENRKLKMMETGNESEEREIVRSCIPTPLSPQDLQVTPVSQEISPGLWVKSKSKSREKPKEQQEDKFEEITFTSGLLKQSKSSQERMEKPPSQENELPQSMDEYFSERNPVLPEMIVGPSDAGPVKEVKSSEARVKEDPVGPNTFSSPQMSDTVSFMLQKFNMNGCSS